jgi:GGDEF domain-containing protein
MAQILKNNIPKGTSLCRYGGDEFVLLSDKCVADCEILAKYLLTKIKQYEFHGNINISVSAGIAGGRRRNQQKINIYKTVTNLINLASLASTKAKKEKVSLVLGYNGTIDDIA